MLTLDKSIHPIYVTQITYKPDKFGEHKNICKYESH